MDYLTQEQRDSFAATNALLGLGSEDFTAEPVQNDNFLSDNQNVSVMSSDSDESTFTPHYVQVGSIAELRKIAGLPEPTTSGFSAGKDDDNIYYPPPPSEADLQQLDNQSLIGGLKFQPADDDLRQRITQAAQAFVMGDPEKVSGYEPLINAAMYPGQVVAFTGDTLKVPDGGTLLITGKDPIVLNFGQIVIGDGAKIVIQTDTMINSQIFENK